MGLAREEATDTDIPPRRRRDIFVTGVRTPEVHRSSIRFELLGPGPCGEERVVVSLVATWADTAQMIRVVVGALGRTLMGWRQDA